MAAAPIDLMPAFWRAYDATLQAADRAAALDAAFFGPRADIYQGAGIKLSHKRIAGWLPSFDRLAADARRLSAGLSAIHAAHIERFLTAFPDFDPDHAPVYFMPSFYMFDAHLQPWRGKLPLFIGLDGIVRFHGADANLNVLLDHESFHLYQGQVNPDLSLDPAPPVFVGLWLEGTATYVSQKLNPQAGRLQVLLDDKPLAAAGEDIFKSAVAALTARLESVADDDMSRFFSAGYKGDDLPARSGYLVGLALAKRVGRRLSPAAMARLKRPELLALIKAELPTLTL